MRIMYLIDFGFDVPNGSSHLVIKIIDGFLSAGHSVYLVQSRSVGKFDSIPDVLKGRKNFKCEIVKKADIKRNNFIKRYLCGIKYELDAYRIWKHEIDSCDVIINHSHYTSPYTAFLLRKEYKKVVFNIYDIFPGEAYINGSIKSKLIYKVLAGLESYVYKHSSLIFTLTKDTKNTLLSLGVPESKIVIIPNWFDEDVIHPVDNKNNSFVKKYNLNENKKYIQYAGSIGVSYDFDLILDVAQKLKYRKDIVFQIVGEGMFLEKMKERASEEHLDNVQFIPWQPAEMLSDVYSACTLQIVPLRSEVIRNSYPSKILPLMACGRIPIVSVEKNSYFYEEVNQNRFGVAIPSGDIKTVSETIIRFADDGSLRHEYEKRAFEYVNEHYSAKRNIHKMVDILMQYVNIGLKVEDNND